MEKDLGKIGKYSSMSDKLRKLQLLDLEILKVIDAFCKKYNIHYSLYAGSLLGAVRHQGFIPWDDDLDIFMTRHEYDRFIKLWCQIKPEGYVLQNKEIDVDFTQSFTKIRKDHTTFLQFESERGKYHTGIFVDVFPIDRIPKGKLQRIVFRIDCMLYQLYTREYIPPAAGKGVKICSAILLKLSNREGIQKRRKWHFNRIIRYNKNHELPMICIETMETLKQTLPKSLMDKFIKLKFEDMEAMCIEEWDTYLNIQYGDYMKLPPEKERVWGHHPLVLDFEKNLNEI